MGSNRPEDGSNVKPRSLRKKVKPGLIELDPVNPSILISCETQLLDSENNDTIIESTFSKKNKRVSLKSFTAKSSTEVYAKEIIDKCKFIHPSKETLVEGLLQQLKERLLKATISDSADELPEKGLCIAPSHSPSPASTDGADKVEEHTEFPPSSMHIDSVRYVEKKSSAVEASEDMARLKLLELKEKHKQQERKMNEIFGSSTSQKRSSFRELDSYVELLYEEEVSQMIIGTSMILKLVQESFHNIERLVQQSATLGALARVLAENWKRNTELTTNIIETFFELSFYTQLHSVLREYRIGERALHIVDLECKRYQLRVVKESDQKRMVTSAFLARQEKLLWLSFSLLQNLAEDIKVEIKMLKMGLIKFLLRSLDRDVSSDTGYLEKLQISSVNFLRKLSLFKEGKNLMVKKAVVRRLLKISTGQDPPTCRSAMRLGYNLSFDERVCKSLADSSALMQSIQAAFFSRDEPERQFALRVLYNITKSPFNREKVVSYPRLVESIVNLLLRTTRKQELRDALGVAINFSMHPLSLDVFLDREILQLLIKRVLQTHDAILMKLIHNISCHSLESQVELNLELLQRHASDLLGMAKRTEHPDLLAELVGTLGHINLPSAKLLAQHKIGQFLLKHLLPGFEADDIVLSCIMLLGNVARDEDSAEIVQNSRLVHMLAETISTRIDDEEMTLQAVFTTFRLLLHAPTRDMVFLHDDLIKSLINLEQLDQSDLIRYHANLCLDIIAEYGPQEWQNRIRDDRFEAGNSEWLRITENDEDNESAHEFESPRSIDQFGWETGSSPSRHDMFDGQDAFGEPAAEDHEDYSDNGNDEDVDLNPTTTDN